MRKINHHGGDHVAIPSPTSSRGSDAVTDITATDAYANFVNSLDIVSRVVSYYILLHIDTTLYNHLERRVARRGMGESVSEYVNLLSRWSIVEGDR